MQMRHSAYKNAKREITRAFALIYMRPEQDASLEATGIRFRCETAAPFLTNEANTRDTSRALT